MARQERTRYDQIPGHLYSSTPPNAPSSWPILAQVHVILCRCHRGCLHRRGIWSTFRCLPWLTWDLSSPLRSHRSVLSWKLCATVFNSFQRREISGKDCDPKNGSATVYPRIRQRLNGCRMAGPNSSLSFRCLIWICTGPSLVDGLRASMYRG